MELARLVSKGDAEARDKLVQSNLRFVVSVAKKYQVSGIPLIDLINEGNMGLLRAVEKYDADRGYHFISYAVWWIRQAILKAISDKSRIIRLPMNKTNELKKIENAITDLSRQYDRIPTSEEIAEITNIEHEEVNFLMNMSSSYVPLDSAMDDSDERPIAEIISDDDRSTPDDAIDAVSLGEKIDDLVASLSEMEQEVLELRFGLHGRTRLSLDKIGRIFGLSKERIRQIEKGALIRLRRLGHQQKLEAFLA